MRSDPRTSPMTGAQLAEMRTGMGMSQSELAAHLGMHHDSISKLERGEKVRLTVAFAVRHLKTVHEEYLDHDQIG